MKRLKFLSFLRVLVPLLIALLMLVGSVNTASAWRGGDWKIVPSPNPGSSENSLLGVAAISARNVWAVGYYTNSGGPTQTLIEHWNGTKWRVVPSPNVGPNYNSLFGVSAISAVNIWAVGSYTSSASIPRTLIEHWNGTKWSVIPSPNAGDASSYNFLYSVSGTSASNVWAVGVNLTTIRSSTLIEHWNGTKWSIISSPNAGTSDNYLFGISAFSKKNAWAVGYYYTSRTGPERTLIEHWNGTKWSIVPSPSPGPTSNVLNSVTVLSARNAWAVGDYSSGNNNPVQTLIEHWNGTKWSVVPNPNVGISSAFQSVTAVSTFDVWAVGYYIDGNPGQPLIEHWNGKVWRIVSSPNAGSSPILYGAARVPATNNVWAVGASRVIQTNTTKTLTEFKD